MSIVPISQSQNAGTDGQEVIGSHETRTRTDPIIGLGGRLSLDEGSVRGGHSRIHKNLGTNRVPSPVVASGDPRGGLDGQDPGSHGKEDRKQVYVIQKVIRTLKERNAGLRKETGGFRWAGVFGKQSVCGDLRPARVWAQLGLE